MSTTIEQTLEFDSELIRRYDTSGPRYTSYPTAVQFTENFGENEYRKIVTSLAKSSDPLKPLSLYFHIPFCDTVCFYCGCNRVITKNRAHAVPYLESLHKEIEMQAGLYQKDRPVTQLHWGGGTPTFISHEQMRALMQQTGKYFKLLDDDSSEYSIEVDPREANAETIALLRELGFNRLSMGVQDFDPDVQKAVNRIQSEQETFSVIEAARKNGFKSVSIDLIYGLPLQSAESFAVTLDKVIDIAPDRFSVFNYAHLPHLFKMQKRIISDELPSATEKLAILDMTIDKLHQAGYIYIGMDHFARPDDELAIAQREGTLYRNFQGYSTQADCDLLAMGATSISKVGNSYCQNIKELNEYSAVVNNGHLPVYRGIELNDDDLLRREIITQLMCNFNLKFSAIEKAHAIIFKDYFSAELRNMESFIADDLVSIENEGICVHPKGRLLIRNICMQFDNYLTPEKTQGFSKVI